MALTSFTFGRFGAATGDGLIPALVADDDLVTEDVATAATNGQTTATAPHVGGPAICRVATDTTCYVSFGANPDATTDAGRVLMLANTVEHFIVPAGVKGAAATPAP